ncbi:MAG TPA: MarC family protein [Anaerolineales bacterium]|nr:MarC family protein [Anaerolineales bacterium]HNN14694.1 MarC family protein [Anaerolineales bacterium]HNO32208.1 MarC family protein [Anaerolineales bacterium]
MSNDLFQFGLTAFSMLLVVINPVAVSPVFVAVTSNLTAAQRRSTLSRAVFTACCVALFFLFVGRAFLSYMGVSVQAFAISGGILLFSMAFPMLMGQRSQIQVASSSESETHSTVTDVAIFPLTIPQLAGPGTIATVLLLSTQAGEDWSRLALLTGIIVAIYLIAWPTLFMAERIMTRLGEDVIHIITRVLGLVLAALAVQYILNGLTGFYQILVGK